MEVADIFSHDATTFGLNRRKVFKPIFEVSDRFILKDRLDCFPSG